MFSLKHISLLALSFLTVTAQTTDSSCVQKDPALTWLATKLTPGASIACAGTVLQLQNAGRYWGSQFGKNASVVVYPTTKEDVSFAVMAASTSIYGKEFAFVGGAHGMTGASSATGFIIDLGRMRGSQVVKTSFDGAPVTTHIAYQGGANWLEVESVTNGTGYTAVGARVSSVGVGGFSTGGGIGFLAGAHGFAGDRLRAMEVVLMNGTIVLATRKNQYSDLFWALNGGGGQFGIVTTFWQEAVAEPTLSTIGVYFVDNTTEAVARKNVVDFFNNNTDPFSLLYYVTGVFPANLAYPTVDVGIRTVIACVQFSDPSATKQKPFNQTFGGVISGLKTTYNASYQVPYASVSVLLDGFFPYGFRRGFYGPQTTKISVKYLEAALLTFSLYVQQIAQRGDVPATALWALQYMSPGLNGNLPKTDADTAWPHSVAGHQTLFSPAYLSPQNDNLTLVANAALNLITHSNQALVGPWLADYPNYISPEDTGRRVWGSNVPRLICVKQKYDPQCRIHQGRVFATDACIKGGWANIYPN